MRKNFNLDAAVERVRKQTGLTLDASTLCDQHFGMLLRGRIVPGAAIPNCAEDTCPFWYNRPVPIATAQPPRGGSAWVPAWAARK